MSCDACELEEYVWDASLPHELTARWKRRETDLLETMVVRRTLASYQKPVNAVERIIFGDASGCGIVATAYTFIY